MNWQEEIRHRKDSNSVSIVTGVERLDLTFEASYVKLFVCISIHVIYSRSCPPYIQRSPEEINNQNFEYV